MPVPMKLQRPVRTALLIEDDSLRAAIEFALDVAGLAVTRLPKSPTARDGSLAQCEIVVVDLHTASVEAVRQLKEGQFQKLQTIVLVTAPSLTFRRFCQRMGVIILEKPLLDDDLVSVIKRFPAGGKPRE